ncbi:Rieske (2Fe-2S) protein [Pseudonocardia sp. GCM10023141]|uniref:Rieske (2Fe-2S) protein n=1 Tax=Pseudonocardia sp. GCM10023141 TaxID=3252653 RepID=UPI00361C3F43
MLDELSHGVPTGVKVAGGNVMLVRWGDEVFASRGICPHQARSLIDGGQVQAQLRSRDEVGEVSVDASTPTISCPWHTWKFDLRTGECAVDPKRRMRTYPVTIEDGRVFADLPGRARG